MEKGALRAALTQQLRDGSVTVVDALSVGEIKTKAAAEMLKRLGVEGGAKRASSAQLVGLKLLHQLGCNRLTVFRNIEDYKAVNRTRLHRRTEPAPHQFRNSLPYRQRPVFGIGLDDRKNIIIEAERRSHVGMMSYKPY